ncbi:MAG: energy-coupling factor transporter ATPase [Clostridia bacterium]|nr:energy-coupling factor transporter ATPase [Clostridia bacterium]
MVILEVKNVSYGYSHGTPFEITALDDVSFSVEKGELVGIIGHTGSGKSTLIKMLNSLLKPESGQILLDGKDINKDKASIKEARSRVGLCFQYPEYQLFEETCAKDIAFGPKNMGLSKAEIEERVIKAAEFVGFSKELLNKSPFDLSGGQKRRCAIAGVMAMFPEVLILDEPTAGLDPKGRNELTAMIENYRKATGATVMIVSHSMDDMARNADRLLVMNKGKLAMDGKVQDVFSKADKLIEMGLSVPVSTSLVNRLNSKLSDMPTDVFTVEDAAELLSSYYKRRKAL